MTTVSDNFNRADGTLGSSWATISSHGTVGVVSNQARLTSSGYTGARWTADTIGADQYCEADCDRPDDERSGVMVRVSSIGTGYMALYENTSFQIWSFTSDMFSFTTLASAAGTKPTGAHTYRLEISGSALTFKVDGVTKVTTTDSTYSTGQPGIYIYTEGGTPTVDNFAAGDLTAAAKAPPLRRIRPALTFR